MIGDKISDCIAGISVGVDSYLLKRGSQNFGSTKDLKSMKIIKSLDSDLLHSFFTQGLKLRNTYSRIIPFVFVFLML